MKVTHVVRQFAPSIGGLEEMVGNLATTQLDSGRVEPRVITLNRVFRPLGPPLKSESVVDGVRVSRLSYVGSERYPLCPQVLSAIAGSDIVHVHGVDFFFDFLACMRMIHRKPLVASTHGGFFHTAFARRLKKIYFRTVTRASVLAYDRIVATSHADGDEFSCIVPDGKLRVIENGVDLDKFSGAAGPEKHPAMIYFGRWSSNKGVLKTVELFAAIAKRSSESWRLVIAGRPYDIGEEAIEDVARRHGISHLVRVVANPDVVQLRELIGCSTYFVCLSRHEGFGLAAVEAMSAGLIPILADIPPFRRLVEGAGTGLLVNQRQATEEVATSFLQLHARVIGTFQAAVRSYSNRYSWQTVSASYLDVYEGILRSHR